MDKINLQVAKIESKNVLTSGKQDVHAGRINLDKYYTLHIKGQNTSFLDKDSFRTQ